MNPRQDVIIGLSVKSAIEEDAKFLYTCVYDGNKVHNMVTFEPFVQSNGRDCFFTPSLKLLGDLSMAPAVSLINLGEIRICDMPRLVGIRPMGVLEGTVEVRGRPEVIRVTIKCFT